MEYSVVLSGVDLAVIVILWSTEFLYSWMYSLCVYTSTVFFTPEQLGSDSFEKNELSIFVIRCLGALTLAFLVDAGLWRKVVVSVFGLCLFALTPVISLFTTLTNSLWSGMIMFWPCSTLFIVLPVIYCLIFNQKLNANSTQVRRTVAVLEMGNAMIELIVLSALPEQFDNSSRYSVVFMWVITIPLLVTLFTLLERIRKFIKGDFTTDKSVNSVIVGLHHDLHHSHHSGRSAQHVVFFSLLLLPAMSLSIIGSTLDSVSNEDAEPPDPLLVNLLIVFQMITIPLIEVGLAMTQIKEDMADYSVLIIAHLTNVLVLVLIVTSMRAASPFRTVEDVEQSFGRIKRGTFENPDFPLPQKGKALFMIMNGLDLSIEMEPKERFDPPAPYKYNIRAGQYTPGVTSDRGEQQVVFRVVEPPSEIKKLIKMSSETLHLIVAIGGKAVVNVAHKEYITRSLSKFSKVYIINTLDFTGAQVKIAPLDGSFEKTVDVPPSGEIGEAEFPGKICSVSFKYIGSDPKLKELYKDDKTTAFFEGYDVGVVYLHYIPPKMNIKVVRIIHEIPTSPTTTTTTSTTTTTTTRATTKPPPTTRHPFTSKSTSVVPSTTTTQSPATKRPPKPPSILQFATYALAGAALGTTSVAYTHFFWMESPLRLRTTMFAAFRVADEVVYRLTPVVTGDGLSLTKAYALLSLQVFTTIVHLVLGYIFQTRVHPT
ncbi:hypothetical protein GE061_019346 [Apolygus lucorum]|uniref:Uncharacterized protein n=1 Tax=Apolygus lucorum TaxID=248454 RepID=A0A6A4JV57_APOLU|nr:hypothetical protein GE061_019346 [Apolygus lucorum]